MNIQNLSDKQKLELAFKNHKEQNFRMAENLYQKILKNNPNNFQAIFLLGSLFFQTKNYNEAVKMLAKALNMQPKNISVCQNLGATLIEIDEFKKAIEVLTKASKMEPDHEGILYNLGNAHKGMGEYDKAANYYEAVTKINSKNTKALNNLGNVFKQLGKSKEAIKVFKKALLIQPKHINANHNIAIAYKEIGDFKNAKEFYKKSFDLNSNLESLHALSEFDEKILNDETKIKISNIISDENINKNDLAYGKFLLSKYELKNKNYKKEFDYLLEGHSDYFLSKRKFFDKGIDYWLKKLSKVKELFGVDLKLKKDNQLKPIFIVGVPRCGSTLLEKVISSGPKTLPMGEEIGVINFILGKKILENKSLNVNQGNITEEIINFYKEKDLVKKENDYTFTDKTLDNFFFIGIIRQIFPNAKIINCKRRPLSSIMSILRNNLGGISWAHDLKNIFEYFDLYHRTIEKFKSDFPNYIHDIQLENFVKNPESESKKIMEYCELPWDKKCLEFYKRKDMVSRTASNIQVRKAIFNNSSDKIDSYKIFFEDFEKKYSWFN